MHIVLEHPDLPDRPRTAVDPAAVREFERRGWIAVGPASDPRRDPLLTDAEQAAADAEQAARVTAWQSQLTPQPVDDVDADIH